jgi:hypothetical protein
MPLGKPNPVIMMTALLSKKSEEHLDSWLKKRIVEKFLLAGCLTCLSVQPW